MLLPLEKQERNSITTCQRLHDSQSVLGKFNGTVSLLGYGNQSFGGHMAQLNEGTKHQGISVNAGDGLGITFLLLKHFCFVLCNSFLEFRDLEIHICNVFFNRGKAYHRFSTTSSGCALDDDIRLRRCIRND